ncbi:MAG TPA: flagellar hook-associated protein FlgK [Xanthobacteraceae bacterium]|jgi:flagellar hook-associated protein 1 FlgK
MSLTQALNAATAGLNVTQQSLSVTAGNIANAQTPGYVRKTLEQQEQAAGASISVGTGAITRQLNVLVQSQLQTQTSGASFATKLSDVYQQLQTIYGAPGSPSGLDTLFNGFTTALQSLQANPSSPTTQGQAINAAQVLAQQLNQASNGIQSLRESAEQGISTDVQAANNALQEIASINAQVTNTNSADAATSSLLDQRDQDVAQLAQLMDIKVVQSTNNQIYVYTGSGTQLVGAGQAAAQLSFSPQGSITADTLWNADPSKSSVGTILLTNPGAPPIDLIANGSIQSGEIGAYLKMRDTLLPQAQTQLDQFAANMSQALSDVTTQGTAVTSGGVAGFSVDTGQMLPGNAMQLTYTDSSNVQHTVSLVNVNNPSVLPLPSPSPANPGTKVIGVDFSGGMASVVTQLNTALGGAGLQFSNPAGTTLQVTNTVAATATVNSLSATATMTSLTSGNPQMPLFVDGANIYSGAINPTGPQQVGFAQRITVNPTLLANPADMVAFSTSPPTASGDPTRPTFLYNQLIGASSVFSPATGIGGTNAPFSGTLTSFLGQVMSQQGQAAANASSLQQGQQVVLNALQQRMDTVSGVNIDTEMTNLLNLQNTYAANARVFSAVQQMFQTLLQM